MVGLKDLFVPLSFLDGITDGDATFDDAWCAGHDEGRLVGGVDLVGGVICGSRWAVEVASAVRGFPPPWSGPQVRGVMRGVCECASASSCVSDEELAELASLFSEVVVEMADEVLKWGPGVTAPLFDTSLIPVGLRAENVRRLLL